MEQKAFFEEGEARPDATNYETETVPSSALAAYSNKVELTAEDIQIPRLRLMQGLSKDVTEGAAKPGQWAISGFPAVDKLNIVPIAMAKRRELRDADFAIDCMSLDSITGTGDPGGVCADCPMNQWTGSKETRDRKPPACTFFYSYMVYIYEYNTMATIDFRRTGINTAKKMNTFITQLGFESTVFELTSHQNKSGKGTYQVADVSLAHEEVRQQVIDAYLETA